MVDVAVNLLNTLPTREYTEVRRGSEVQWTTYSSQLLSLPLSERRDDGYVRDREADRDRDDSYRQRSPPPPRRE